MSTMRWSKRRRSLPNGGGQCWWSFGFVFPDGVLGLVAGFLEVFFILMLFLFLDTEPVEAYSQDAKAMVTCVV